MVSMMDIEQIKHHVPYIQKIFESHNCPDDGVFSFRYFFEGLRMNMVDNRSACDFKKLFELKSLITEDAENVIKLFRSHGRQEDSARSPDEGGVTGELLLPLIPN